MIKIFRKYLCKHYTRSYFLFVVWGLVGEMLKQVQHDGASVFKKCTTKSIIVIPNCFRNLCDVVEAETSSAWPQGGFKIQQICIIHLP